MSEASPRWSSRDVGALALVILFAALTRFPTVNRVFDRDPEGCGSYYGQIARNYFRYDIGRHFAVPIQSIGVSPDAPVFYPNHPPLLPLLIATTYKLVAWNPHGNDLPSEWSTRLSSTLFTIGCAAMIFAMIRNRASLRAAIGASILFSATPMALTFGSQPDVINAQLCFFAMLTLIAYLRFIGAPSVKRFALLCLGFAPAAMSDWPAFHLVVVLVAHYLITQPLKRWGWIIAFGCVASLYFVLLYAQVVAVLHDWSWMRRLVQRRALSSASDRPDQIITLTTWIKHALYAHGLLNVSLPIAALAMVWIGYASARLRRHPSTLPIVLLLAWAVVHIIVGRQGVFVHEWWWWPLMPGAAMAAGVAVDQLMPQRKAFAIVTHHLLAVAIALNIQRSWQRVEHPSQITRGRYNYSLPEIGAAIRAAAPINEEVLLAESDETIGLWFYADRPFKRNIWHPYHLQRAIEERFTELPFGVIEPWSRRPVALVVPRAYVSPALDELLAYCRTRYAIRESEKFITFDLRRPARPAATTAH